MRCKLTDIKAVNYGTGIVLTLAMGSTYGKQIDGLIQSFTVNTEYEIKPYKQKRSLSANAYAWVLMDMLADKLHSTKEEIYRQAIGHVGVFEEIKIENPEALSRFKRIWRSNGEGWLTKTLDEKTVLAYYGSSVYDTKQMARLIDYVQDECRSQGIEIRPQWEVDAMLNEWGNK